MFLEQFLESSKSSVSFKLIYSLKESLSFASFFNFKLSFGDTKKLYVSLSTGFSSDFFQN